MEPNRFILILLIVCGIFLFFYEEEKPLKEIEELELVKTDGIDWNGSSSFWTAQEALDKGEITATVVWMPADELIKSPTSRGEDSLLKPRPFNGVKISIGIILIVLISLLVMPPILLRWTK